MSECQTKAGNLNTFSLSHSLSLSFSHSHTTSLSHSRTLSLFQSLIQSLSTCWTTFVFMSMLKSHPHTFSLSLFLAISLSHSFNLSFNHSRHAEQVLFSSLCWKLTVYRWKRPKNSDLVNRTCDRRGNSNRRSHKYLQGGPKKMYHFYKQKL